MQEEVDLAAAEAMGCTQSSVVPSLVSGVCTRRRVARAAAHLTALGSGSARRDAATGVICFWMVRAAWAAVMLALLLPLKAKE